MIRIYTTIFIILIAVVPQGCSFFRHIDDSPEEEIKMLNTTKAELWNDNEKLKKSNRRMKNMYQN